MADKGPIKQTAAVVLGLLENVFSFAATFNPLFGIVTTLVGAVKKGLVDDDTSKLEKDFQQIHEKLESISEQSKKLLDQIHTTEITINYGNLEKNIEHQYRSFKNMVENTREAPEKSERYKKDFKKIYIKQKGHQNLNRYYDAIMENEGPFGKPLLKFYLEHYKKSKEFMEAKCSHLAYIFQIGLIALMAYYVVTEDDEDEFREEWGQKVLNIQTKMIEVLEECNWKK